MKTERELATLSYCGLDGEVSQGGWLTSLDTTETSATEKTEWISKKLRAIHSCGSKVILTIRDGCLKQVAVPIRCHSPACPTCARLEQEETMRKYRPLLEKAKRSSSKALFITFTTWQRPKDGDELRSVFWEMSGAYRKLLDMRLGPRKRKWLRDMFYQALEASDIRNKDLQAYLFEEFLSYCERNRVQKFRDLIKVGIRRPEITYNREEGWFNPHFHVLWFTDCPIPQVLLSYLWASLTGSFIVDIREAYDDFEKELIKYMTKFWEIPEDKIGEVLWGLRGMKKVMLHGVKLIKEPKTCPYCSREDCKAHPVAMAELEEPIDYRYRHGQVWGAEVVAVRKMIGVSREALVMEDPKITIRYTEEDGFTWEGDWISFDLSIPYQNSVWVVWCPPLRAGPVKQNRDHGPDFVKQEGPMQDGTLELDEDLLDF